MAKKNACLCKLWVAISVLNIIFSIVGVVKMSTVSTTGIMTEAKVKTSTVSACIGIAVELCLIWVVVAFIRQVQRVEQNGMTNNVELGGQPGEGVQPSLLDINLLTKPHYRSQRTSIAPVSTNQ
ncbi:unnamed protein product [Orchesella dallaii]|uniref:Uncharacterized protein n=1 Tax=Orchesella dallaii TaxID=48710 RepID=A0ABP1R0Y5_9HEXA